MSNVCNFCLTMQTELHKMIVKGYSEKCGGKFSSLPADGYVHHELVRHVAAAGTGALLYNDFM